MAKAKKTKAKAAKPRKPREKRPEVVPLTEVRAPDPGPNILAAVSALEPENVAKQRILVREIHDKLLYDDATLQVSIKGGRKKTVYCVPGHIWGDPRSYGPSRADVMVIGKAPGREEQLKGRLLQGPPGAIFRQLLNERYIQDYDDWYVTNLLKYAPPEDVSTPRSAWIKDNLPLLHRELRLVRPKHILCLGSDASRALLGKKYSVGHMLGRVVDHTINFNTKDGIKSHTALVMSVLHPSSILRFPEKEGELQQGLDRWALLLSGKRFDLEEDDIDHRVITTLDELEATLYEAEHTNPSRIVAVDAEWHGHHPQNKGAYLRTIQISWAHKKAACIVLRHAGGKPAFQPNIKAAISRLMKFFQGKRVVGHFLNADLEWLIPEGLDLRPQYEVPTKPDGDTPAWLRTAVEGGADVGLSLHSVEETAELGLEHVSLRFTTAPRYDLKLNEWKDAFCKEHGLKAKELEGFGQCPPEVLYPYANYDADVTRRAFFPIRNLVDCDHFNHSCRETFWRTMMAYPAALEINRTGLTLDMGRVENLTKVFLKGRTKLERKLRKWARWDDFNIRSPFHVRELLFGKKYNGKKPTEDGKYVRIRPEGARCLMLDPLIDTSRRPVKWSEIREAGREAEHTPGTKSAVLEILAQENLQHAEPLRLIRDYRFLDQAVKTVLKPPEQILNEDDPDGDVQEVYKGGLASFLCDDGRVRTHIYPTLETGRWASARPPLQCISKKRDRDYLRILEEFTGKLRGIFRATRASDPGAWINEDCLLVESDYTGAELAMMAWMSGDVQMIDHVRRSGLPESHKDYFDIHSNVTRLAFRLECEPTKAGLKAIDKYYLRDIAKAVMFGIAYGRGPKAIAFEARVQNVPLSEEEARAIIDAIFQLYPNLSPLFEECARRAREDRFIFSCFGRCRRVPKTDDRSVLGDFERQFKNFPIQGGIADVVGQGISNLYNFRQECGDPDMFRIVLQIHDAILLEVPKSRLEFVVDKVIPQQMCRRVPVFPTDLGGVPMGTGPFYLSGVTEVFEHWGESISVDRCRELGIAERFAHAA